MIKRIRDWLCAHGLHFFVRVPSNHPEPYGIYMCSHCHERAYW